MPTTADSPMAGWALSRFSMSRALIFSPPLLMMSLILPVIVMFPDGSFRALSPVLKNPSWVKISLFSSGDLKYPVKIPGPFEDEFAFRALAAPLFPHHR